MLYVSVYVRTVHSENWAYYLFSLFRWFRSYVNIFFSHCIKETTYGDLTDNKERVIKEYTYGGSATSAWTERAFTAHSKRMRFLVVFSQIKKHTYMKIPSGRFQIKPSPFSVNICDSRKFSDESTFFTFIRHLDFWITWLLSVETGDEWPFPLT